MRTSAARSPGSRRHVSSARLAASNRNGLSWYQPCEATSASSENAGGTATSSRAPARSCRLDELEPDGLRDRGRRPKASSRRTCADRRTSERHVERLGVHVHPDELVGIGAREAAAELQRVRQGLFAVLEAGLDARLERRGDPAA